MQKKLKYSKIIFVEIIQSEILIKLKFKVVIDNENFLKIFFREDPSKIFVCVGFGFYVEFTHSEALRYISKKIAHLENQATDISKSMAGVKAHIRMVVEGLRELQDVS